MSVFYAITNEGGLFLHDLDLDGYWPSALYFSDSAGLAMRLPRVEARKTASMLSTMQWGRLYVVKVTEYENRWLFEDALDCRPVPWLCRCNAA